MPWYSFRELQRRFGDVQLLGTPRIDAVVERLAALQRYGLSVRQRRVLSSYYSAQINKQLEQVRPDIVVSVAASHKITKLDPKWPMIHVTDGMFGTIAGYYEKFGRFRQSVLKNGHDDHQRIVDKARMVLFASDWARDSALELYDLKAERTRVVPFGANLDTDPGFHPRPVDGPITLLFVGYDWKRKGGDLVLEIWRELRRRTGDAQLRIIGTNPPGTANIDGITVYGRLHKAKPDDYGKLVHSFNTSSFFVMPSRQEAFGMVFCEAAAYGIPSVATATGGVPTVVKDGTTGMLLPPGAPASAYVERILALWNDKARYNEMSRAARARYEDTLNWTAWGDGVESAINIVLNQR